MLVDRKLIFDAAKRRGAVFKTRADVADMDQAIDLAVGILAPAKPLEKITGHRKISAKGKALIHSFESFEAQAYKDPGSANGLPISIGWGATKDEQGRPIKLGDVWTRERADAVFELQIADYEKAVDKATLGTATNQNQFDAMVSLCYNIGIGAFQKSSVLRRHKAGDVAGAAAAFLMWIYNDGKPMKGLRRRRAAEADLYDD